MEGFVWNASLRNCGCPSGTIWDGETLQCICTVGTYNPLSASCDCPLGSVWNEASAACACVGLNVIKNGVCTPITTTTTQATTIATTIASTVATTVATTKTPVDFCNMRIAYKDISNMYIKSLCVVLQEVDYATASSLCIANKMKLFIVDNSGTQTSFLNKAKSNLNLYTRFFINGKSDSSANWITSPPDTSLFSFISWDSNMSKNSPNSCIALFRPTVIDEWSFTATLCTYKYNFICEYV